MKRRQLLLGAGTLLGAGGALGTGAFTSVSADRSVQVNVVDDASAYLRLVPVPGSGNAAYVNTDGGTLSIDISDGNDNVLGNGVNPNATTVFDDLFRIENQGTQTIYVWILESGGRNGSKRHAFYAGSWEQGGTSARAISLADYNNGVGTLKRDGRQRQPQFDAGIDTAAVELGVGEFVDVGLVVDTPEGSAGSAILKDGQTMTINATADREGLADVFTPVYDPS
ncbi:DUF1102 domain-containing protein [Haloplanus salinus]|uniref:DUF1102 domain-containing protein n=1 Tax=Haloplanus salinus TaxID=1126245 RepID=A0A368NCP2_9EURY|nr:DUF1102 domain-containing protein [Haloplanus salinus]